MMTNGLAYLQHDPTRQTCGARTVVTCRLYRLLGDPFMNSTRPKDV